MVSLNECVSKAFAVVLPSFEETAEQTRLSIWRETLHSGGVDVHSFMYRYEPIHVLKDKNSFKYRNKYKILDFHNVYMQ